jgi:hypothetical protein
MALRRHLRPGVKAVVTRWQRIEGPRGPITEVDWSDWLDNDKQLDPYLVWADHTDLAGMGGWGANLRQSNNDRWPLLIEFTEERTILPAATAGGVCSVDAAAGCDPTLGLIEIGGAYKSQGLPNDSLLARSRYVTGRVQPCALRQLLQCGRIRRFQLGLARVPETNAVPRDFEARPSAGVADLVVIGIIDDGCAYAHPAFRDSEGDTRVRYLWDQDPQSRNTAVGWKLPAGLGYGAELDPQALKVAVEQIGSPWAPYEYTGYVPVRLDLGIHGTQLATPGRLALPPRSMRRDTHGSGVMHLAAGRPPPGSASALGGQELDRGTVRSDAAGACPIVFVQLPSRAVLDTSGGSLGVHVLDALRYLELRASSLGERKDKTSLVVDLVANVSYGAIAGPHDGTSILELAFESFVRERENTWIVVAAGNSHRARTHAQLLLTRGGDAGHFVWRVGADNPLESYLEVWLPSAWHHNGQALPEGALRDFVLQVRAPGTVEPRTVRMGELWLLPAEGTAPDRTPRAGIVFARRVAQGDHGTMVLLAVGPTRRGLSGAPAARQPAPHGDWVVQVHWAGASEPNVADTCLDQGALVHAWAERNDLLYGLVRPQQSSVVADQPVPEPTEYTPDSMRPLRADTLSCEPPWALRPDPALGSTANVERPPDGPHWRPWNFVKLPHDARNLVPSRGQVVVVGGYRLADSEMTAYSSGGPVRGSAGEATNAASLRDAARRSSPLPHHGPAIDAPADVGTALRGVRVAGMHAGQGARLSGTSAAAPQVTRLIANLRSELIGTTPPVTAALQAKQDDRLDQRARELGWFDQPPRPSLAPQVGDSSAARPTPSPTMDDLFRRGRHRVR